MECSYEAWIIYNFMSLCLEYVGGPGEVEVKMQGVVLLPSWAACTCCLPPLAVNGHFVRIVKQGALQFVLLKPLLAILTVVLYATGNYTEGDWSGDSSFLWITIVYNITYSLALYALLLFYMGTHELLAPFKPLLKFILVKSVIFLTFWQGLFVSIAVGTGLVPSAAAGNNVQNFLICIEMLPAAVFMLFAFPWKEYLDGAGGRGLAPDAVTHAMSLRDVVTDTMHQFAPTYQQYVLYSDGTTKRGMSKGGGSTATAENGTADLLASTVEMGEAEGWGGMETTKSGKEGNRNSKSYSNDSPAPLVGRSRYLSKDDEAAEGEDVDARWQSINIRPPE